MVSIKTVTAVLFVVNWVHLSSTLSDECLRNLDDGQGTVMYKYFIYNYTLHSCPGFRFKHDTN